MNFLQLPSKQTCSGKHDHRLVVFAPSKASWLDEQTLAVRRSGFEFALAHFPVGHPVE